MPVAVVGGSGPLGLWMPLLLLLLLLLLLWPADSCMETGWSSGRLGPESRLPSVTLRPAAANSCTCCALCHREQACASLSFNSRTAQCELYSSVASYATLLPDPEQEWTYLVMPGRSQREEFCRQDADCRTPGDACRGRICTDREAVTCRVIAGLSGARDVFGTTDVSMFGWLADRETALECDHLGSLAGFTELLSIRSGAHIDNRTILELNRRLDPSVGEHSILGLTDEIRQLRRDPTYHIAVLTDTEYTLTEVPREETLTIEGDEDMVHISFRERRGVLARVTIPTATAAEDAAHDGYIAMVNYEGMHDDDGRENQAAYDWFEIYIRE